MTNEEKELLEPMIRSIMEKSKGHVTDEEVAKALETLGRLADNAESIYSYEHPDYGALVKEIPETLRPLINNDDEHDDLPEFDDLMDECSKIDHDTLADAVNSIIYYWLDKWHKVNNDEDKDEGVWLNGLPLAIVTAERFGLRECIPALLEIERQDRDFAETFFDDSDMAGMPASCIYQIATADDLPQLTDFVRERGIHTFSKAEVIAAGATLPRREPKLLPEVQQWLCEVLGIFADDIDPEVGDVMLLEAIIHCCIHTRCEAAKPMIIRMYSKYKMPNIMIPGGVNEVRKTIKRADIGVLAEDRESAEAIYMNADTSYDYDDEDYDDEDYDDDDFYDDYEEIEDDEDEYDEDGNVITRPRTSVTRFFASVAAFAFAIYMVPGLWGAPLKAISAFAPPMRTQDFNINAKDEVRPMFTDYESGMRYAKEHGKPVMLDFTGHGCVNCRKMEAAVFTDEEVASIMTNDYVLIQLFVDDKTPLDKVITVNDNGTQRKLRTVGDKWSYLQSTKFGASAQPFYVLLSDKGQPLNKEYSYDEDTDKFREWLRTGLRNNKR